MTEEELKALADRFRQKLALDPEIRSLSKKIADGTADFSDTSKLFWRRSVMLREYTQDTVLDLAPEDRQRLVEALLHRGYDDTTEALTIVQEALDEAQGLHLNPVVPKYPAERVTTVAHALMDPTVPDEKIVRRAGAPVANVNMSFHDDYMKENAKIRAKLGFKCYLNRVAAAGCCKWCTDIAGRYVYGDQPDDVFHRHDNCGCTVTFENGRERQDVWSKRTWQASPLEVMRNGFQPARNSPAQAAKINENAQDGLTLAGKRDIIEVASNAHPRNPELEKTIKRCIKQDKPFFDDGLLGKYSERIPLEENRYITSMHGTNNSVMLYDQEADAKILANIIRSRSDYNGEEIVLISCNTGNTDAGENCFAQQLANELGVRVHAPTRYGAVNSKGEYYSSDKSGIKRDGEFKPFEPRRG